MKVKYFLRGLGIGVLVTTLLLFAGTRKNDNVKLTDEQIIERAKELGMLTEDEVSDYKMDKSLEDMKTSLNAVASPSASQKPSTQNQSEKENEPQTDKATQKPSKDKTDKETVTIKIKSGMASQTVAKHLYEKKIIDSASDFNDYMKALNLSKKIRAGKYEIPVDASYSEIVKLIT